MIEPATFIAYVAIVLGFVFLPGPATLLTIARATTSGTRVGVATGAGVAAGDVIHTFMAIVGLSAIIAASAFLFSLIKYAGAAYLVWIGINLIRAGAPLMREDANLPRSSLRKLTLQELWVAAGNPKAILVFTAFFPQFVDPSSYALSFTILGATFLAFEIFAIIVYSFIGAKLGRYIRDGRTFKWFNRTSGGMMIGFGLLLMFTRRPAT